METSVEEGVNSVERLNGGALTVIWNARSGDDPIYVDTVMNRKEDVITVWTYQQEKIGAWSPRIEIWTRPRSEVVHWTFLGTPLDLVRVQREGSQI